MRHTLLLAGALATLLTPAGAHAAGGATVTVSPTTADPDYATSITVSGNGFRSIKGGFGGIYVLFGTVQGTWQPSKGGGSGTDYVFVQDVQSKGNHGYQRFVSFPDGGTLAEANGGIVDAAGHWQTTMVIPGATFPAIGPDGRTTNVDCRTVTCGIITIGAHGVVEPANETFTPISFADPTTQTTSAAAAPVTTAAASTTTASGTRATPAPATADPVPAAGGLVIPTTPAAAAAPAALTGTAADTTRRDAGWWATVAVAAALVLAELAVLLRRRVR